MHQIYQSGTHESATALLQHGSYVPKEFVASKAVLKSPGNKWKPRSSILAHFKLQNNKFITACRFIVKYKQFLTSFTNSLCMSFEIIELFKTVGNTASADSKEKYS